MKNFLSLMKKVIPKEMDIFERRLEILGVIYHHQPIGRRNLSHLLEISEKIIRSETEILRNSGLIEVNPLGMILTQEGINLLSELGGCLENLHGLKELRQQLISIFQCKDVLIVPGDVESSPILYTEIGMIVANLLLKLVEPSSVIAITGGRTVSSAVDSIKRGMHHYPEVIIVPARGSVRGQVEFQANNLTVEMAKRMGATYQLINLPDNLSSKALESVSKEPDIEQALTCLKKADILIYGIGNAIEMADKRQLSDTVLDFLIRKKAKGEALGYYFDESGEIVYSSRSIGIKIEQMTSLKYPIAVAAGKTKAKAIYAVKAMIQKGYLIIDEAAAREIISHHFTNND